MRVDHGNVDSLQVRMSVKPAIDTRNKTPADQQYNANIINMVCNACNIRGMVLNGVKDCRYPQAEDGSEEETVKHQGICFGEACVSV